MSPLELDDLEWVGEGYLAGQIVVEVPGRGMHPTWREARPEPKARAGLTRKEWLLL